MANNKKRVLTVFYKHKPGGYCKRFYQLIQSLLADGYEVHYVASRKLKLADHENLHPHLIWSPIRFKELKGFIYWTYFSFWAPLYLLYFALIRRHKTILTVDAFYALYASLASILTFTPITLLLRAVPWRARNRIDLPGIKKTFFVFVDLVGIFAAKRIIVITKTTSRELVKRIPLLKKFVKTQSNALAHLPEEPLKSKEQICKRYEIPENDTLLLCTGELNSRRNIEKIVRAISAANANKLSLLIYGDGPEKENIQSLIIGLGLIGQVQLTGSSDDLESIVAASDLLIMPSLDEGMAYSMMLALRLSIPVIAANGEELREVLVHEELLFDPNNVEQLSGILKRVTEKKELEKLRDLSEERAKTLDFDWEKKIVEHLG